MGNIMPVIGISVGHLVATYGYLALFLTVTAESIGIPVPGETALLAAAIYAGSTHKLGLAPVVAVAAVGAVIGGTVGFFVGRRSGEKVVLRFGRLVRIDRSKLEFARWLFTRHGGKIVFLGRFVTILRSYIALVAGTSQMAPGRFVLYNALGAACWAGGFGLCAYELGGAAARIGEIAAIVAGSLVFVVIIAGWVLMTHYGPAIRARIQSDSMPH